MIDALNIYILELLIIIIVIKAVPNTQNNTTKTRAVRRHYKVAFAQRLLWALNSRGARLAVAGHAVGPVCVSCFCLERYDTAIILNMIKDIAAARRFHCALWERRGVFFGAKGEPHCRI